MDIVFVILHYKTYDDTVDCIDSIIKRIDTKDYKIIVIDNASENGSYERLDEKYRDDTRIVLIKNENNLGFSNGLNVGISYARNKFDPDFIAAINNDTMLLDGNLTGILREKYAQYNFAVFGPMIITKDGKCDVNPIRNTVRSIKEVEKAIRYYRTILNLCRLHLFKVYTFLNKNKTSEHIVKLKHLQDQVNYKLHGSFWIFSRRYFEKFEGLDSSTFLYGEEDILYLQLMATGLSTLYSPDIKIYHREDSSTNNMFNTETEKMKFICVNCIKSLKIYEDLYTKYNTGD